MIDLQRKIGNFVEDYEGPIVICGVASVFLIIAAAMITGISKEEKQKAENCQILFATAKTSADTIAILNGPHGKTCFKELKRK
jgi:hypothetical protein